MPRKARVAPGGFVYHVLNRAVARLPLFRKEADFEAFERVILEAHERHPTRLLAWCLMRTHWHMVIWPERDGELTAFVRWLSHTHAMRWHVAHRTVGGGHLYQGRFKNFPIQRDEHFLTVCRYVERNALTAGVVTRAEDWRFGSLRVRQHDSEPMKRLLAPWPVHRPTNWVKQVNEPVSPREQEAIRICITRACPYGGAQWQQRMVRKLGLQHTIRSEGRPRLDKRGRS
ncbi:MAG: transposase [Phycisphaerae bacterium]|nr:transposase [Phycisphaerae bacterium]